LLPVDEVVKIVHGTDYSDVMPVDILRVLAKASKDIGSRKVFLSSLWPWFKSLLKYCKARGYTPSHHVRFSHPL